MMPAALCLLLLSLTNNDTGDTKRTHGRPHTVCSSDNKHGQSLRCLSCLPTVPQVLSSFRGWRCCGKMRCRILGPRRPLRFGLQPWKAWIQRGGGCVQYAARALIGQDAPPYNPPGNSRVLLENSSPATMDLPNCWREIPKLLITFLAQPLHTPLRKRLRLGANLVYGLGWLRKCANLGLYLRVCLVSLCLLLRLWPPVISLSCFFATHHHSTS